MKNTIKIQYQFTGVQTLSKTSVPFRIKVKIFMWLSRLFMIRTSLYDLYDQNLCSHILTLILISGIFCSSQKSRPPFSSLKCETTLAGPWTCCSITWNAFPPGTFIAPSRASSEATFQWGISWLPCEQLQILTTDHHHHFLTLFELPSFYPCAVKVHTFSRLSVLPPSK